MIVFQAFTLLLQLLVIMKKIHCILSQQGWTPSENTFPHYYSSYESIIFPGQLREVNLVRELEVGFPICYFNKKYSVMQVNCAVVYFLSSSSSFFFFFSFVCFFVFFVFFWFVCLFVYLFFGVCCFIWAGECFFGLFVCLYAFIGFFLLSPTAF